MNKNKTNAGAACPDSANEAKPCLNRGECATRDKKVKMGKKRISPSCQKKSGFIYAHVEREYTTFVNALMYLLKEAKWLCPSCIFITHN